MPPPTPEQTGEVQNEDVRERYEDAIARLLEKVTQDPGVLAVVLLGSLAYDVVWAKSDIDLTIILQDTQHKTPGMTLVERGVTVHADLITRAEFKKRLGGATQGSFLHDALMRGRLLFTRDDTLKEIWEGKDHYGERDREALLLHTAISVTIILTKAQKWLSVKHDPYYSFLWIMKCLDGLATLELVLAGEPTGREVVPHALALNPAFFGSVYTGLIDGPKTPEAVGAALGHIEGYIKDRVPRLFRPLLDYLAQAGGVRSAREINDHFEHNTGEKFASVACEWLADEGFIQQAAVSARLTEKGRVNVEEVAYYYDADERTQQ